MPGHPWSVFACAVIGLTLNLLGTAIAGWAIYSENREHGGNAILPVGAAHEWVRVKVFRRAPRLSRVTSSRASAWAVATLKASAVVWPAPDAPVATQVEYLQREVLALHTLLASERREIDEKAQALAQQLSSRIAATEERVQKVDEKVRGLATQSVRWEVLGLFLVGAGSVISVLPAALGWN